MAAVAGRPGRLGTIFGLARGLLGGLVWGLYLWPLAYCLSSLWTEAGVADFLDNVALLLMLLSVSLHAIHGRSTDAGCMPTPSLRDEIIMGLLSAD